MIGVMVDIAEYSMSYFDTAKNKGKHAPENFYHGLVLGPVSYTHLDVYKRQS